MNLLLLEPADLQDGLWRLGGRRARHVATVLRAQPGDGLKVGLLGGALGEGRVLFSSPAELVLDARLDTPPPPRARADLLLAMPRPKVLRRVLHAAASMGVARLVLLGAARVEKSYFDSPLLAQEAVDEQLRLGLEQGGDTLAPTVLVRRRFKPFVEDELDALWPRAEADRLLAHPGGVRRPARSSPRALLAVGPEGGWVPFESELLQRHGFELLSLGPRPLKVEVAVPALLAVAEG